MLQTVKRQLFTGVCLALLIGAGMALTQTSLAHAAAQPFQAQLAGQITASQITTGANGQRTVTQSQTLRTVAGQYPAVTLTLDVTENLVKNGSGKLTGGATIADSAGSHTIFTAIVTGAIAAGGGVSYRLIQPKTVMGAGGALTWSGAIQTFNHSDLSGTATGTLQLPAGLPAALANSILPGSYSTAPPDPALWYLTRGAAMAAYLVLTVATALGIGISTRAFDSVSARRDVLDLHQTLTLVLWALVGLHLVTLALDTYIPFGVANLLWPVGEPYKPIYVALGVIGLYSLVIVSLSSWVRERLPFRLWRGLHYLSALSFVALTLHGVLAGTDTQTPWMLATYVTSGLTIVALLLLRIARLRVKFS